ncbi:HhH-GPD family protein [Halogranum rubrum]|uniref:hypothetical protein n=1 Tax=Halogranum rubrum TaxID=553466 RepID=UPI001ED8C08E|nr:hypothetical protein [Halogranum salarium]
MFVAEFFLTQTPADNVASVYPEFITRFPSLRSIRTADEGELADVIEPLGFQNLRAEALRAIAADYDDLPRSVDELSSLQRVGPYVANATLCFAFNRRLPIVDRNVDRVYRRVFDDRWPRTKSEQWETALELVPESDPKRYNLALRDFGAAVCTPDPRCEACFANKYCAYYQENVRS